MYDHKGISFHEESQSLELFLSSHKELCSFILLPNILFFFFRPLEWVKCSFFLCPSSCMVGTFSSDKIDFSSLF